ncbi:hypothetical protein CKAH01_01561 [Colletotrichum kahawae]|uniref:Uncharacterized protein n=1 Tax=Colletotrichum kahawae TaxID=34407 RepID=A0AAE0D4B4_COLKA|nr:hypothetical protein CKAH01_01561 [Colletotrichum kahawae]
MAWWSGALVATFNRKLGCVAPTEEKLAGNRVPGGRWLVRDEGLRGLKTVTAVLPAASLGFPPVRGDPHSLLIRSSLSIKRAFRLTYHQEKSTSTDTLHSHLTMSNYSGHNRVSTELACHFENHPVPRFGGPGSQVPPLPDRSSGVRENLFVKVW